MLSYRIQVLSNRKEEPRTLECSITAVIQRRRTGPFPLKQLTNKDGGLILSSMFKTAYLLYFTGYMNESHLFSIKDTGLTS